MHTIRFGLVFLLVLLAATACGGRHGGQSAARLEPPRVDIQGQIEQLEQLAVPAGVDSELWSQLKGELRRVLMAQPRLAQTAPLADASQTTLSLDEDTLTLSWLFFSQGDYDQNGEVNISDLTPIAQHFGESSGGGGFAVDSVQSVVDGDANGEINISDISPIGVNFGRRAASYNVYRSLSADDVPADNAGPNGAGAELMGNTALSTATGTASQNRLALSFVLPELKLGWFYWVRPNDTADGSGQDGTPSSLVSFGGKAENLAPVADITADPASGDVPLTVEFDASASSDPDGVNADISDIVQFEWDFDEDLVADAVTSTPVVSHTYETAGDVTVRLRVTDAGAATDVGSVVISIADPANQAPVASLGANPLSGAIPLEVDFDASGSTDDGPAADLSFDWDFDGDGIFDVSTGNTPSVSNIYQELGSFTAKVRVRDAAGGSDESTVEIVTSGVANERPDAVLEQDHVSGTAPLQVTFTVSNSSDPDGSIEKFELDAEGDGDFETTISQPQPIIFTYENAGQFVPRLRVTDNANATDEVDGQQIQVTAVPSAPIASFTADPLSGDTPLLVSFDGSASVDDVAIVDFAWDFDGDGTDDFNSASPTTTHSYDNGGSFKPRLTVTDGDPLSSSIALDGTIEVDDPSNAVPTASIVLANLGGTFPQVATFDPSGSSDSDGTIVRYDWDFDGDFDFEFSTFDDSTVQHTYFRQGNYAPNLRVVDNDGDVGVDNVICNITKGWVVRVVKSAIDVSSLSAADIVTGTVLKSHNPGVAFLDSTQHKLFYSHGSEDGASFATAVLVDSDVINSSDVSLANIGKQPAVAYASDTRADTRYCRSDKKDGSEWGSSVKVRDSRLFNLTLITGNLNNPAMLGDVSDTLFYVRADNNSGSAWEAEVKILNTDVGLSDLVFFSGQPRAVVDRDQFSDSYLLAADGSGSTWSDPFIVPQMDRTLNITECDGRPAIAGNTTTGIRFSRANNADGNAWPATSVFVSSEGNVIGNQALAVVNGIPCIAFVNSVNGGPDNDRQLMFSKAKDQDGASWNTPQLVDAVGLPGSLYCLIDLDGRPAIAWYDPVTRRVLFGILL